MRIVKRIAALITIAYACIGSGYAQLKECGLEEFRCYDGECIAGELLCDGKADCKDSSDETQAECSKSEILCPDYAFRCKYGACVNGNAVCNGIQDCIDNSDETLPQCATNSNNQTERPTLCKPTQFTCNNRQCISNTDVCNGTPNCADGSDETAAICGSLFCNPTVFRCAYGACIDGDLRCNGENNCADGSDEDSSLCNGPVWKPEPPRPRPRPTPTPTQPDQTPVTSDREICKAPSQPPNGHWQLHRSQCANRQDCDIPEGTELAIGSHLIYSCNRGYKIRGSSDVSCSFEGIWINVPVCIEIRCKPLSTVSTEARCSYLDEWVSCESPVLPRTRARLSCRNSYRRETSLLSSQREDVRCGENGQWEPEPIRCVPDCGKVPPSLTPLIVNGTTPNVTEFPWHVSMYQDLPGEPKKYFCGASIIQENLLITAAHCVYEDNSRQITNNDIYVVTGNFFRDYDSPFHDTRLVRKNKVKNIYIVCNYLGLVGNYLSDIAILELVEPFELTTWLVPVCIDPFSDHTVLEAGSHGRVAGFGRTDTGDTSAVLQSITVPYIPFNQCKSASQNASTEQFITSDKFCAGYSNGSAVCDGDSGGGLVFKANDLWYLRGIVSVSLGTIKKGGTPHCNPKLYSLYTRIFNHIGWIQDVIARLERHQPFPSCEKQERF